jgi:hypothetical protein
MGHGAYDRRGRRIGLKPCPGSGFGPECGVAIPLLKHRCGPCSWERIEKMKAERGRKFHLRRMAAKAGDSVAVTDGPTAIESQQDCPDCGGMGSVSRYIGHEGRGARFTCHCKK